MLTKTVIKGYTHTTSYDKGLDLYRRDKVDGFSVEEMEGMHVLCATVKGSGRNRYRVYLEYDIEEDCLERMGCECPAFRQLLVRRQQQSTQSVVQGELYGSVKMEPVLTCDTYGNVSAEFKIGASHMYVLKDVFSFANALRLGEHVPYGQKLQFVHRREMFAKDSLVWVDPCCF